MKSTISTFLSMAIVLATAATTHAADITFGQKGWEAGDLTAADTILAVNLGTVDDAFDGDEDGSYSANGVSVSFFSGTPIGSGGDFWNSQNGGNYGGTTFPTGPDAETLLDNLSGAYNAAGGDGSVDISGLTIGKTYEIQLICIDDLPQNAGRTMDIWSGDSSAGSPDVAGADHSSRADDRALLVTGIFMADATTQSLWMDFTGNPADGDNGWLNAMQFREITTPETDPPVDVTVSPEDDATDVAVNTDFVITFDESVKAGSGYILIKETVGDGLFDLIDVTSIDVTFAGDTVTIDLFGDLENNTGYYLEIPAGAIKDAFGNDFAGITNKTEWNFTTTGPQAPINFVKEGFDHETDLSTDGTLIAAVNLGTTTDATLNGITFSGNNTGSVTAGAVTIDIFGADFIPTSTAGFYNGTTVTGVDADNLLDTIAYAYDPFQGDGSVDFSGLTIGQAYEVQLLLVDDRGGSTSRTVDVLSSDTTGLPGPGEIDQADFTSRSDSSALLVTGTFTAVKATQSLFIQVVGFQQDAGHLNALQLREIATPDTDPPVVVSLSPPDDSIDVFPNTDLVITFDDNVLPGSGSIIIKETAGDGEFDSISVNSLDVSFDGAVVTINPFNDLDNSTGYYIEIPAGAIKDAANNSFAGITGKTAWNFVTADPQATITFTQEGFDAETDLATTGTLIAAVNLGTATDATLNGITFSGNTTGSVTAGGVTIEVFGDDFLTTSNPDLYHGTTVTGADADNLLESAAYSSDPEQGDGSVNFTGLTVGRTYEVQLLLVDDRQFGIENRTVDVVSGYNSRSADPGEIAAADYTSRPDESALLVTGTFTAAANNQSLFIQLVEFPQDSGHLNALQLRDVTGVGNAFDDWAGINGLDGSPGKEAGFDAGPDGDMSNGLEWILGTPGATSADPYVVGDPLAFESLDSFLTYSVDLDGVGDDGFTFDFTRVDESEGVAMLQVAYTTDLFAADENLVTIGSGSSTEANGVIVTISENGAAPDVVSVFIPSSNAPDGRLFGRFVATLP
jgi:hypothetical protein